jgi:hypothetical protein
MNNLIFPDNLDISRPFHFADEVQPSSARIGGNMPEGISVTLNENAEYFGTFPLYDNNSLLYFSLFINCPFAEFIQSLNNGFQTDNRIRIVLHEDKTRSNFTKYASKLSQHTLVMDGIESDIILNDQGDNVIREGHKFGGRPFCIQEPNLDGADELFAQGYRQVLQIDFPNPADGRISGSWPFGDGIFNLFWKHPFEGEKYYWYLQG